MTKIEDIVLGDRLLFEDDSYPCILKGSTLDVQQDDEGKLFVQCNKGGHFLSYMSDAHGVIHGVTIAKDKTEPV